MNNNNQEPALQFEGQYDFGGEQEQNIYDKRSISLWFKVDEIDLNRKQIIYAEDGQSRGLDIYVEDGRLYFNVWQQSDNEWSGNYASTSSLSSETWHHVGLVIDSDSELPFNAYIDGVKIERGDVGQIQEVNLGIGGLAGNKPPAEALDDANLGYSVKNVGIYDRVLTQEDIDLLHDPNLDPELVDDETVTIENTKVILLGSQLLDNDLDPNEDSLTITSVGNATSGSVAQDSQGNIIFTPEFGFSGETSFEYTVEDDAGGATTAMVSVEVLPQNRSVPIGTSLHSLVEVSPELPFINGLKTAPDWLTQDFGVTTDDQGNPVNTWNTGENSLLDLDEDGWVKSIPTPDDDPQYSSVGALLFRNLDYYPGGEYIVLYEGEGTIEYNFDAQKNADASVPGRDVININPSKNGVWFRIDETDPNNTGDYIRNIRVVPAAYEELAEQTFSPDFLNIVSNFEALRYVDWMKTNNSQEQEWSDRAIPNGSIFSEDVVSVETMVELANLSQTDPWFSIPHQANDEYVSNFAQYVKENLDPELTIYLEYSNEIWNPGYDQARWLREQGEAAWPDPQEGSFGKRLDWYGRRTTEVTQIWDEVFGDDSERVIGIIGGQASNTSTVNRVLEYNWAESPLSHEEYGIDAISVSPNTAAYLKESDNADEIASWTSDPDGGVDKFFTELTEGGVLSNSQEGGAFQEAYGDIETFSNIAKNANLDLITYETDLNLPTNFGESNYQAIKDLFEAAQRDPRIAELYQEHYVNLSELGADLSLNFNDLSAYNQWGSWWELDGTDQSESEKLNLSQTLTAQNFHNLSPQMGPLANNLSSMSLIVEGDSLDISANYTDVNQEEDHEVEFTWGDESPVEIKSQEVLGGEIGTISGSHVYPDEGNYTTTVTVTDSKNLTATETLSFSVIKQVELDWRPYSTNQTTSLAGEGEVIVGVFGKNNFLVNDIDLTSIRVGDDKDALLNGEGITMVEDSADIKDINSDGVLDLLISFDKSSLRDAVTTEEESLISDDRLFLFGSNSELESGYFFGTE